MRENKLGRFVCVRSKIYIKPLRWQLISIHLSKEASTCLCNVLTLVFTVVSDKSKQLKKAGYVMGQNKICWYNVRGVRAYQKLSV